MAVLFFVVLGYLSGNILYAYWLPKLILNVDIIKNSKDKNPGTANAFKQGNISVGIMVICLELLKGLAPVYFASFFVPSNSLWFSIIMAAPVIGHAFPIFKPHEGGKAIAVTFGVLMGLFPVILPLLTLIVLYLTFTFVICITSDYNRSIVTFFVFIVLIIMFFHKKSIAIGCIIDGVVVIYKHILRKC